jgi:hypothetical protein
MRTIDEEIEDVALAIYGALPALNKQHEYELVQAQCRKAAVVVLDAVRCASVDEPSNGAVYGP